VVEFDPVAGARLAERGSRRICEYSFRLGPNGFEGLGVRGRTASGLRDDRRCLYRLSQCFSRQRGAGR